MATKIPDQLKQVAEQVYQGVERNETVRTLLSWFESERRGYWKVHEIRKALRKVKLKTEPDFEDAWIDAPRVSDFMCFLRWTRTTTENQPGNSSTIATDAPRPPFDSPDLRLQKVAGFQSFSKYPH